MSRADVTFHEATVTSFSSEDGAVQLSLENVTTRHGVTTATVVVSDIEEVLIDGRLTDSVRMEFEDGEVLSLDILADRMDVIIVWNDFKRRLSRTRSYCISGRLVQVSITPTSSRG